MTKQRLASRRNYIFPDLQQRVFKLVLCLVAALGCVIQADRLWAADGVGRSASSMTSNMRITLRARNVPPKALLDFLSQYVSEDVMNDLVHSAKNLDQPITVDVEGATLDELLRAVRDQLTGTSTSKKSLPKASEKAARTSNATKNRFAGRGRRLGGAHTHGRTSKLIQSA